MKAIYKKSCVIGASFPCALITMLFFIIVPIIVILSIHLTENNKINPLVALKASGQVIQNENNIIYDNLKIATNSPINVRILNLIFKKSLLKKGNFDCNITLNGELKLPKVSGKVNLYDLDIPLYDTKIDNIKLNISNKFIKNFQR